jgi:peptidylprolyl isomerase
MKAGTSRAVSLVQDDEKRTPGRWAAPVLAMLLAVAPALAQTPSAADPVVAQRGAITLTASQVRSMVANADPQLRHELQTDPAALDKLVRDRLLQLSVLVEAHDHQWDTRPEVVWRADQARDNAIAQSYVASLTQPDPSFPSEAEVQAAYAANKGRLVMPRQYHLAQIYLAVPPGAPGTADATAQKRLADMRAELRGGRADFATLARRQSDDHASAPNGGDLGWVREDQVLPAVRGVVAGLLADGSVSEPIRAGDGWHLVRLLGTRPAAPATLAEVHDALVRALRQQRQQQNTQAYVDGLLRQEPIRLDEIQLSGLAKP